MFARELKQGQLVQSFKDEIALGRYWLTSLRSKSQTAGMKAFQDWLPASDTGRNRVRDMIFAQKRRCKN